MEIIGNKKSIALPAPVFAFPIIFDLFYKVLLPFEFRSLNHISFSTNFLHKRKI